MEQTELFFPNRFRFRTIIILLSEDFKVTCKRIYHSKHRVEGFIEEFLLAFFFPSSLKEICLLPVFEKHKREETIGKRSKTFTCKEHLELCEKAGFDRICDM